MRILRPLPAPARSADSRASRRRAWRRSGAASPIVGSPAQVADALQHWVAEADVDGFNLSRTVIPECLEDFIDLIVPVLQDRGAFKTAYSLGTYRQKLFGAGDRLPDDHPAAKERWIDPM